MTHAPEIVRPDNPSTPHERGTTHPHIALTQALTESSKHQSVANRIPNLKKSAYILLGLVLFSVVQSFLMESVMISMLGAQSGGSAFVTISSTVAWVLGGACAILLLTTKDTKLAKHALLAVGVCLIYFLGVGLMHFDIVGVGINAFLVWWTYDLYQSVEALEIRVR